MVGQSNEKSDVVDCSDMSKHYEYMTIRRDKMRRERFMNSYGIFRELDTTSTNKNQTLASWIRERHGPFECCGMVPWWMAQERYRLLMFIGFVAMWVMFYFRPLPTFAVAMLMHHLSAVSFMINHSYVHAGQLEFDGIDADEARWRKMVSNPVGADIAITRSTGVFHHEWPYGIEGDVMHLSLGRLAVDNVTLRGYPLDILGEIILVGGGSYLLNSLGMEWWLLPVCFAMEHFFRSTSQTAHVNSHDDEYKSQYSEDFTNPIEWILGRFNWYTSTSALFRTHIKHHKHHDHPVFHELNAPLWYLPGFKDTCNYLLWYLPAKVFFAERTVGPAGTDIDDVSTYKLTYLLYLYRCCIPMLRTILVIVSTLMYLHWPW